MTQVAVEITHEGGKTERGKVPVRAVPHWEARGYKVSDPEQLKAARAAAGITDEQVTAATEAAKARLAEEQDQNGTAAVSAESTSESGGGAAKGKGKGSDS